MKYIFTLLISISVVTQVQALLISEVMSNPVGDDSGREWIEVYNNSDSSIDLSPLTISIKGGVAVAVTPLSGGTMLAPDGYAIIGSTVSGSTKFLQDYPNYSGLLFKSSISLVNTGITSIDIKLSGSTADSLSSYTAAKEGYTLSLVNGSFAQGSPTPGTANEAAPTSSEITASTSTDSQITVAKQSAPSPDIILYIPSEKTVVAGAESFFSTFGMTRAGIPIEGLIFNWAFGDGGQGMGSSTIYKYVYPGRYIAKVEANNNSVAGSGIMKVRVVSPDISIVKVDTGKYGAYVDILNPNNYELDLSQWKLLIDGKAYPFPKNTLIAGGATTRFSGLAMGFASTTVSSNTVIKILFPNMEDVTVYTPNTNIGIVAGTSTSYSPKTITPKQNYIPLRSVTISTPAVSTSSHVALNTSSKAKDTRFISWIRSFFSR